MGIIQEDPVKGIAGIQRREAGIAQKAVSDAVEAGFCLFIGMVFRIAFLQRIIHPELIEDQQDQRLAHHLVVLAPALQDGLQPLAVRELIHG